MYITFDPDKDKSNIAKHGVSLAEAAQLEWQTALLWQDLRRDYNEVRMAALVLMGNRLYCVTFTDRGPMRRIISLRKANEREVKNYAFKN